MTLLVDAAKRLQVAEYIVPPSLRLPVRYHGQRIVGGLEPEMRLLPKLVKRGGIALDIGANRGVYAYALSKIAAAVHCFEPLIECCHYIEAYASRKITVHNVALSDQAGTLRLYVPIINGSPVQTRASLDQPGGAFESREIPVSTLDAFSFPPVDFIKIDVEGLEASVLRGAQKTLIAHRPALLIEIDHNRHIKESFLAVHADLESLGYSAHTCINGSLHRSKDVWADSTQHINFIFLPR